MNSAELIERLKADAVTRVETTLINKLETMLNTRETVVSEKQEVSVQFAVRQLAQDGSNIFGLMAVATYVNSCRG